MRISSALDAHIAAAAAAAVSLKRENIIDNNVGQCREEKIHEAKNDEHSYWPRLLMLHNIDFFSRFFNYNRERVFHFVI